ncbi:MAG: hypothetical protein H6Q65_122 [Firmicutes bacterium]|nr:hypothetical protein [Bacillota bacterium]
MLELQSPKAKLSIETEAAKLEIRQPAGVLEIDGTASRASIGLKTPTQFALDQAEAGRQTVLETIARTAQNGDRLARIQSGETAIAEIAADEALEGPLDITWAPLAPPEIHFMMQKAEITVAPVKPQIQAEPSPVQAQYTPGSVDIRIAQYEGIRFWTTGSQVDRIT